jgi:hypothetical protein
MSLIYNTVPDAAMVASDHPVLGRLRIRLDVFILTRNALSSHFIQRGKQATNDDPFANTPSRGSQRYHGSNRQQSNDPSPVSAARTSANWRTSSSGSDESPKQVNRKLFQNDKPKSPEGTIDPKNAQAIFPPSACVFVAK